MNDKRIGVTVCHLMDLKAIVVKGMLGLGLVHVLLLLLLLLLLRFGDDDMWDYEVLKVFNFDVLNRKVLKNFHVLNFKVLRSFAIFKNI